VSRSFTHTIACGSRACWEDAELRLELGENRHPQARRKFLLFRYFFG
jgi:hypothetical protein